MSAYGYEIVQTLIVDIEPDVNVKRAMNEINAGMYKLHILFYPWLRYQLSGFIFHIWSNSMRSKKICSSFYIERKMEVNQ